MTPASYGFVIFAILLGGVLVGAGVLQAACSLYNRLVGASVSDTRSEAIGPLASGVPNISFGQGIGIVVIASVLYGVAAFLVNRMLRGMGMTTSGSTSSTWLIACLLTIPVGVATIAAILPTDFSKGILVALLFLLLWFLLSIVTIAMISLIVVALGGLRKTG